MDRTSYLSFKTLLIQGHLRIFSVLLMKNYVNLFCVMLSTLMLTGCFYDEGEPDPGPPDGVVSYSLDIQPIFNTHCTSCHPGIVESPDLSEGNSYGSISDGIYIIPNNIEVSLLYQRIIGNPSIMPPNGSLSASEINLIRNWIEQGALNN